MTIDDRPDGSLVISDHMTFLRWGSLLAGVLLGATLLVLQVGMALDDTRSLWAGGWVAALSLALAACVPDRTFVFEPALGRLTWTVRRLIGSAGGVLPLTDIREVTLQTDRDTDSKVRGLSYRVVLETSAGAMPLSSRREFDRDACERVAGRIRAMTPGPVTGADSRAS